MTWSRCTASTVAIVVIVGGLWWWRRRRRKAKAMIEVYKIPIPKDKLRAMPADERALLMLLGYAANQITFFSKLVLFSTNRDGNSELERLLSASQSQMVVRVVIGVLNEAWELIRTRFMSTAYGQAYTTQLDAEGAAAFARLKQAFNSGLFAKLRGNWIFHHPYNVDLTRAFEDAAGNPEWDQDWNWYFSHSNYNSFYFPSEFVALHGILNLVGETDLIAGQQKLMPLVTAVSNDMSQLIMAILKVLLVKYIVTDHIPAEKKIDVAGAPSIFDVWIPFFVDIPAEPPSSWEGS
jgi:hypothetical protein